MAKKKKVRPFGSILLDLESILDEIYLHHDMQLGDVLNLVVSHTTIHNPDSIEEYMDGTKPEFKYGPKEGT